MASLILQEEQIAVEAWGAVAGYHHLPSGGRPFGPSPPPGFLYDVDDSALINYDAYWDAARLRSESALEIREDQAQDLYYRTTQLPVCAVAKLPRRTLPPRCVQMDSAVKGRYLVATEPIKPGQIIAMDTSAWVGVGDAYRHLQLTPEHVKGIQGTQHYATPSPQTSASKAEALVLLQRCCAHMIRYACENVFNGPDILVKSSIIPFLCTFLLQHGDVDLRPARCGRGVPTGLQLLNQLIGPENIQEDLRHLKHLKYPSANPPTMQEGHDDVTGEESFTAGEYDLHNPFSEEHVTLARMAIKCIPARLLGFEKSVKNPVKPQRGKGTASVPPEHLLINKADQLKRIEELSVTPCGFFRRMGLHNPLRLARLIAVLKCNAISVTVPDLPTRSAVFPFLRLAEHECRPNSSVTFLDCPATHSLGETGMHSHDTKKEDRYGDEDPDTKRKREAIDALRGKRLHLSWNPSVVVLTAIRHIEVGEPVSIAYLPTTYMIQPRRQKELMERYSFTCTCRWCAKEPDLSRAFQCPQCPRLTGAICPTGDGTRYDEWECLQCGYHPPIEDIMRMLDREQELSRIKADKHIGVAKLLGDDLLHYTHAVIFSKLDKWSERAWQEQDALSCLEYIDAMKKSVSRIFDPADPAKAQLNEFAGQVQHAVGHAHSSRYEYFAAYQQRLKAGHRFSHWCRLSGFMANAKSLVDLLDSH